MFIFYISDGNKYIIENISCQSNNVFPFPWAFLIVILTIAFCLFVEKVAFANPSAHSHEFVIKVPTRSLN